MNARTVRRPTTFGGLTKGHFIMNLRETETWLRSVGENVRIRSRRLLAFSRDIRGRLDNAAEYHLTSLQSAGRNAVSIESSRTSDIQGKNKMALGEFLNILMAAGFFLVHSHYLSDKGIYVLALPALHDQPELVLDLLTKCLRSFDEPTSEEGATMPSNLFPAAYSGLDPHFNVWGEDALQQLEDFRRQERQWEPSEHAEQNKDGAIAPSPPPPPPPPLRNKGPQETSEPEPTGTQSFPSHRGWHEHEERVGADRRGPPPCRYLLLLSLRQDFLWTGEVMPLNIPPVDIQMHANRLRLVADGSRSELQRCKDHLYGIFAAHRAQREAAGTAGASAGTSVDVGAGAVVGAGAATPSRRFTTRRSSVMGRSGSDTHPPPGSEEESQGKANANRDAFPLETAAEYMAHLHSVQKEVAKINQGIYKLAVAIITEVPRQRKRLRFQYYDPEPDKDGMIRARVRQPGDKGGDVDELIQNAYQMASEHALRSLPFIVSAKVRAEMRVAIGHLSIDWISFITDDCVPTDRRTFKWAVNALEHASISTMGNNILKLPGEEYALLKNKVGICIRLLISHFDILGARSSAAAKVKEISQKAELEQMERKKVEAAEGLEVRAQVRAGNANPHQPSKAAVAAILINSEEPAHVRERRQAALDKVDEERGEYLQSLKQRGRVLDDSRIEDRGLQALALYSSPMHWQLGQAVGSGTFGTVYSALNLDTGQMMAVKEIRFQDIASHPTFFEQIKEEMTVMQLLDNINIVQYYGIEVHRDKVYIFEEYCEGGSLAHLLEMGAITDERVLQFYALQMLDGLSYLHSMGIVHRDIKPESELQISSLCALHKAGGRHCRYRNGHGRD